MPTSVTGIGYDFITSSFDQIEITIGNPVPLKVWQEYGSGNAITGTQSFNGGAQTLILTANSPTTQAGDVIYVICTGDLAGYFTVVSIEGTGFVIDKAFTTDQTGAWSRQSIFRIDPAITDTMQITMRAVGASELAIPALGAQESFSSVVDGGGPQNDAVISGTTQTGSIVGLGRMVKISNSATHDGIYNVVNTPGVTSFEINRAFTQTDSGDWESAIYTPVMTYIGAVTIKAVIQMQVDMSADYTIGFMVNSGSGFEFLANSNSNTVATASSGKRLIFGLTELSTGDEIIMAIFPNNVPRECKNIRFGLWGVTEEEETIVGVALSQITLQNGANPLIPGGTTFDGGGIPFPNVGDPVGNLDVANRQWVLSLLPNIGNYIYVKTEDDFGAIANIRGNPYHIVSQSTIFIMSQPIALTTGGIGINASNISCGIVAASQNTSTIPTLTYSQGSAPIFAIEDMQDCSFFIQNIQVAQSGVNAQLFDIDTVNNLNIFNQLRIENCRFITLSSLGTINYNAAPGRAIVKNCVFDTPDGTLSLLEISQFLLKDNWVSNLNATALSIFTIENNLQCQGIIRDNRMISANTGSALIHFNTMPVTAVATYNIDGNDVRVAQLIDSASNILITDEQIAFQSNPFESSKYYRRVLDVFSLTSSTPGASNTPITIDIGADTGGSSDPVQLSSNVITFNQAGFYRVRYHFNIRRTTNSGTEQTAVQPLLNGDPLINRLHPSTLLSSAFFDNYEEEIEQYFDSGDTLTWEIANITAASPEFNMGTIAFSYASIAGWIPSGETSADAPATFIKIDRAI